MISQIDVNNYSVANITIKCVIKGIYKRTTIATIDVATVLGHRSETENTERYIEIVKLLGSNHKLNSATQYNTLSNMKSFIVNTYTTVKIISVYQSHYKQHSL